MMRGLALLVILAAITGCSGRLVESKADWERGALDSAERTRELSVKLPPYPNDVDLIEFFPGPLRSHHYFIDGKTLDVGSDGIVRYVVVIKAAGGATNVAYEGIRCRPKEKRTYALGNRGQSWTELKRSEWESIQTGRLNEYQGMLHSDYFCTDPNATPNRANALRRLRMGLFEEGSPRTSD